MRDAKILITGGTGFIGWHLAKRCLEQHAQVTILGVSQNVAGIDAPSGCLEHCVVDLRNSDDVKSAVHGRSFHYVFNLAGYIDHTLYFQGGRQVFNQHLTGVMNLIEALDRTPLKAFVQVGSSDEYGDAPAPQREDVRERPISCYSLGKAAATHFIQMLHRTERFPAVAVRLFLVYGPRQDARRLLPQVIRGCLADQAFPASEGNQLRDFTYVEDIIEGLLKVAGTPHALGEVINLASGIPISIRRLIETIVQLIGKGRPQFGAHPYRLGENMALYADPSKARKLLNWAPRVALMDGLRQTIQYYQHVTRGTEVPDRMART